MAVKERKKQDNVKILTRQKPLIKKIFGPGENELEFLRFLANVPQITVINTKEANN